ncbi:MAG: phosphate ABC transporter permease PstA [Methanoregulaceae archaeon]|nr:phosphate ABC transporter permease PstA [Methanoregulaceae archaeon]
MTDGKEPPAGKPPENPFPAVLPAGPEAGGFLRDRHQARRYRRETLIRAAWFICAFFAVITIFFIFAFLLLDAYPIFEEIGIWNFLTGPIWNPTGTPPAYGIWPLIVDTILATLLAMAIAIPLGVGSAIYIAELAPYRVKAVVKPAVELLAGIPSVVFGFFGLIVLTTWIRVSFDVPSGETWLAGSLLLALISLPVIISVSEDALSSAPREYKEGSLALGATHWQTISRVLTPAALSGITAAIILGVGRAAGETMAVLMVTGNAPVIPEPIYNVLSPIRTLTGTLGIEMGEVPVDSTHYYALFGVAVVLLVITLVINYTATVVLARIKRQQAPSAADCARKKPEAPGWRERGEAFFRTYRVPIVWGLLALALSGFFGVTGIAATIILYLVVRFVPPRVSPKWEQRVAFSLAGLCIIVVLLSLGVILFDIISKGLPYVTWEFLTSPPSNLGREGGIAPAIVGTMYLVIGSIAIALPLGIGAAIYLTEYAKQGRLVALIRTATDLLNGTPSIVFGLFGFAFLVLYLGFGVCLLAGQITLALMVLPTIIRTTEESLITVPISIREGSLALGASKWQTIRKVVLPPSVPGILTGTILSIGRVAGETAPILFTAVIFSTRFLPSSLFQPVMALPYHLYILATNVPGAKGQQYATALVLLVLVVAFYAIAIWIRYRSSARHHW